MNTYALALFVHIVGALGLFVALGVEWLGVRRMRQAARVEQARAWLDAISGVHRLGMLSMLAILLAGFSMMAMAHLRGAWMLVAFGAVILLAILAVTLSGRHMAAIRRAAQAESGPISIALGELVQHPLLWLAIQLRVALALGIIFLMTVKPGLAGSLITMATAAVIGVAAGLSGLGHLRSREKAA